MKKKQLAMVLSLAMAFSSIAPGTGIVFGEELMAETPVEVAAEAPAEAAEVPAAEPVAEAAEVPVAEPAIEAVEVPVAEPAIETAEVPVAEPSAEAAETSAEEEAEFLVEDVVLEPEETPEMPEGVSETTTETPAGQDAFVEGLLENEDGEILDLEESVVEADTLEDAGTSGTETLAPGESKLAVISQPDGYMDFLITPTEDCEYIIYSEGNSDTCGTLYEGSDILEEDDDGGTDTNFRLSYSLQANKTYILRASFYRDDEVGAFPVFLIKHTLTSAEAGQKDFDITVGSSAELKVSASSENGENSLTYNWFKWNSDTEEYISISDTGNTSSTYSTKEEGDYKCEVSDGNEKKDVTFSVNVLYFKVVNEKENWIPVSVGGKEELSVQVETYNNETVNYRWEQYTEEGNWATIGANQSNCEATAGQGITKFKCYITNQNDTIIVEYYLYTLEGAQTSNPDENVKVLEVGTPEWAVISKPGTSTYFQIIPKESGKYYIYSETSVNTEARLYDSSDMNTEIASDTGSGDGDNFYITCELEKDRTYYLETKFSKDSGIGSYQVFLKKSTLTVSDDEEVYINAGEKVNLNVTAETTNGTNLNYTWFKYDYDADADEYIYIPISDAPSSATYMATKGKYKCLVSDGNEEKNVSFTVYLNYPTIVRDQPRYILATAGELVSLSVTVQENGMPTTIEWFRQKQNGEWEIISGQQDRQIVITAEPGITVIHCKITNSDYDFSDTFSYTIYTLEGVQASTPETAPVLKPGEMMWATIAQPNTDMWFKIIPAKDGTYSIYSETIDDPKADLYEASNMETIVAYDDQSGEGDNFLLSYDLKAGHTYYLKTRFYYRNHIGSFKVFLKNETCTSHSMVFSHVEREATCAQEGSAVYVCEGCGLKENRSIPATGIHTWSGYSVAKAATVLEEGINVRTCTVCGLTETAAIPRLPATGSVNATTVPMKQKQSTAKLAVTGMGPGDYVASWQSSNTKIVKVAGKSNGTCKLTAQNKVGSANIQITLASGKTFTVKVKVQKAAVKTSKVSVTNVTGGKLTLTKGKKFTLKSLLTPFTSQDKITYSSSNKKVATVSAKGMITATGKGTATITVKSGKKTAKVKVTVPGTVTTKISGIKSAITLKKGKKFTLKAKLTPAKSEEKVTYTSSNKKVATVSAKGVITAKAKGTATITVKSGKVSVKCKVTVK